MIDHIGDTNEMVDPFKAQMNMIKKWAEKQNTMNKKQTAVEWLVQELKLEGYDYSIKQAKAMEKKQMKDTWHDGFRFDSKYKNFKEYYQNTYTNNEDTNPVTL